MLGGALSIVAMSYAHASAGHTAEKLMSALS
jgi:hypothetical protein